MGKLNSIRFFLTFMLFLCFLMSPLFASADQKKVRVAFPILGEFSYIRDGVYGGYIYDYLQEISRYTGWEYEFITVKGNSNEQLTALIDMVKDGRADIMGTMLYTDGTARSFDFPEFNSGSRYASLFVLNDNTQFDEMNYSSFEGMRVGMLKRERKLKRDMDAFFNNYEIIPHVIEYGTDEARMKALYAGEIDAVLSTDFRAVEGERILARFGGEPYYFVTTKGNKRILSELNAALAKLRDTDPNLSSILYKKHFHTAAAFHFYLTEKEKAYVRQSRPIKVVVSPDWAPIQSLDRKTGELQGVMRDILDSIGTQSGLRFEIIPTRSYDESRERLAAGEADILIGVIGGERFAAKNDLLLSTTVMPVQMVTVRHKDADLSKEGQILALPRGYVYEKEYAEENIRYYDNIEECIEAVNKGEADLCYGSALSIMYYTRNQYYDNIALVGSPSDSNMLKIAFAKPVEVDLLTIVNKAILSLPQEKLQQFIAENTILSERKMSVYAFIRGNPTLAIGFIFFVSAVIISGVLYTARNRVRHNRQVALNNERYRLLSELSNEYIYEYDYLGDMLDVSDRLSRLCGCPQKIEHYLRRHNDKNHVAVLFDGGFADSLAAGDIVSEFCLMIHGKEYWVRNSCSTILDEQGIPLRRIGKLLDITAEKREKEGLLKKAQHDFLTGIFNKGMTETLVEEYLKACSPQEISLLIIFDVDNFKCVNDTYGHIFGDTVLRGVAESLRKSCRGSDIAGRVGGDEFVVLLKNVNGADFIHRVKRLEEVLRVSYAEQSYTVCISMGVTLVSSGESYVEAVQRADRALYRAKELGKDQYFIYTPDLENINGG